MRRFSYDNGILRLLGNKVKILYQSVILRDTLFVEHVNFTYVNKTYTLKGKEPKK